MTAPAVRTKAPDALTIDGRPGILSRSSPSTTSGREEAAQKKTIASVFIVDSFYYYYSIQSILFFRRYPSNEWLNVENVSRSAKRQAEKPLSRAIHKTCSTLTRGSRYRLFMARYRRARPECSGGSGGRAPVRSEARRLVASQLRAGGDLSRERQCVCVRACIYIRTLNTRPDDTRSRRARIDQSRRARGRGPVSHSRRVAVRAIPPTGSGLACR